MTNQPDRQDGDGLPLDVRIQTIRYALFRLLRADAPHQRLREEWSKLEALLDAPQPTRDAAEGATRAKCPRCKSSNVTIDRARKPFSDSLVCADCNYVGPIVNENYETMHSATPQPAPDAMRFDQIARVAAEWCSTGLLDDSDKRAVMSFAGWLAKSALPADGADDLQDDLREMLQVLGLFAGARPQSPHEVFLECIAEVRRLKISAPVPPVADDVLIERLKYFSGWSSRNVPEVELSDASKLCWDAIDEITRLRATPPVRGDRESLAEMLKRNGFTSRDGTVIQAGTFGVIDAILSAILPVQPGADEREALIEQCAKIAEETLVGHTLTPSGLARQDEAENIAARIRALSRQPPQSSSDDAPQSGCGVGGMRE